MANPMRILDAPTAQIQDTKRNGLQHFYCNPLSSVKMVGVAGFELAIAPHAEVRYQAALHADKT